MSELKDIHVAITGGAGGIGTATVWRFAVAGAHVSILDRDKESAESLADKVRAAGHSAVACACDVTDRSAVEMAVAEANEAFGPIAVLVNNAGWDIFRPFLQTTPDEWAQLIAINFVGVLNLHHAVLPQMVTANYGRIINIASDAARVGSTGEAVYAGCKAAVVGFSKTIAREHARHGITVNVVCPGPTDTALFAEYREGAGNPDKLIEAFRRAIPLGRIGQPDDLPGAIVYFASNGASFVTGQVLSVSGGLTMAG